MKRCLFAVIIALVLLCTFFCHEGAWKDGDHRKINLEKQSPATLPYGFKTEYLHTLGNPVYPLDYEGDGIDDLLVAEQPAASNPDRWGVLLTDMEYNTTIGAKSYGHPITVSFLQDDLDGDGYKEVCYCEQRIDTLLFHVWNCRRDSVTTFELARNPHRSIRDWNSTAQLLAARDLDGDGCKEIILHIFTDTAYLPRAIVAWDWRRKKEKWRYEMGAYVSTAFICDYDRDGDDELVCSTNSPDNGKDALNGPAGINGTDDSKCYFLALDLEGNSEVVLPIGGAYLSTKIFPFDWHGDGTEDVMMLYDGAEDSLDSGWLAPWNSETMAFDSVRIAIPGDVPYWFIEADVDGDGMSEYVSTWNKGVILVHEQSGELVQSIELRGRGAYEVYPANVLGDDADELIFIGANAGRFVALVFDTELHFLALYKTYPPSRFFFQTEPGGYKHLVVTADKDAYLLSLERQPLYFLPFAADWGLFGWSVAATAFAGIMVLLLIRPRYRLHDMRTIFNTLYHKDGTGYILVDRDGLIRTANPLLLEWLGAPAEAVTRREYRDVLRDTHFSWLSPHLDQFFEEQLSTTTFEYQSGDGRYYVVKLVTLPFPVMFARVSLAVIEDVSEFVQSKRTVAWASMAQKLAHEIKTPLSTVLLSAQQIGEDSPSGKYVRHIREQVERLQSLTEDMLKFAHIEKPRLERISINDLARQALDELRLQIGSTVTVHTEFADDLPELRGDPHQIVIAIKNCISNSLTAMQGAGTLSLCTRVTGPAGSFRTFERSRWTALEITDTGRGMSREELDMLFQPFFSHSPRGTGLGMVIVKKIVDDHRGTITVNSREGEGTSITIILPGAQQPTPH
ncbi:PAS domain S-box protein [bacterium]|nr:PAS domain S-box protein [bacterium]